jgi:hypothetical protein
VLLNLKPRFLPLGLSELLFVFLHLVVKRLYSALAPLLVCIDSDTDLLKSGVFDANIINI